MITKIDLFKHTRTLLRSFVLPAILKSTVYGICGGIGFLLAGATLYWFGPALLLDSTSIVVRLLVALGIIIFYVVVGVAVGLILGGSSAIRQKLPDARDGIHALLSPITGNIIQRIPRGQEGISIARFSEVVDTGITSFVSESSQRSRLMSITNWVSRRVLNRLLSIFRRVLLLDFIRWLEANGEKNINVQTLEQFGRERLIQLVINDLNLKLYAISKITLIGMICCLLIPVFLVTRTALF